MFLKFLSAFAQFVLFLIVFAVGSFVFHPFHVQTTLAPRATQTRVFDWDGLLLMLLLYAVVLLIEALMKQIRKAGPWSTVAVGLATLVGFLLQFGFRTL